MKIPYRIRKDGTIYYLDKSTLFRPMRKENKVIIPLKIKGYSMRYVIYKRRV